MSEDHPSTVDLTDTDDDVTDEGERVTPDYPYWGFYAHLSIYAFAKPFAVGNRVLDAGSGTGYGTHYLLEHGASYVKGVDYSSKAIDFCRKRYSGDSLHFEVMDVGKPMAFEDASFNMIFSSNAMEHFSNIDSFLQEASRVLSDQGVLIAAVPPITTAGLLEANLSNLYHINNLTPRGWFTKLGRFFHAVHGYRHWVKSEWIGEDGQPKYMTLSAEETSIRETDFTFEEIPIETLNSIPENITAVFVAKQPRATPLPSTADESHIPRAWNVKEIRARIKAKQESVAEASIGEGEELQERIGAFEGQAAERDAQIDSLAQTVAKRDAQIRAIYASTSWRLSAPIRWVGIQRFRARAFFARVRQQHRS